MHVRIQKQPNQAIVSVLYYALLLVVQVLLVLLLLKDQFHVEHIFTQQQYIKRIVDVIISSFFRGSTFPVQNSYNNRE